jgi:NHL repeat
MRLKAGSFWPQASAFSVQVWPLDATDEPMGAVYAACMGDTSGVVSPLGGISDIAHDPVSDRTYIISGWGRIACLDHPARSVRTFAHVENATRLFAVPDPHRTSARHLLVVAGNRLLALSDDGAAAPLVDDGPEDGDPSPRFSMPQGMAMDSRGRLLVADAGNQRVCRVTFRAGASPADVEVLAGASFAYEPPIDHPHPLLSRFHLPHDVAVDRDDNVYVADTGNVRVRRIEAATGAVTTFARCGIQAWARALPLTDVVGVTYDPATGALYVSDATRVCVLPCAGEQAGLLLPTIGWVGGPRMALVTESPRHAHAPLLVALRAAPPIDAWPPGLAELTEAYARPAPRATALLASNALAKTVVRIALACPGPT